MSAVPEVRVSPRALARDYREVFREFAGRGDLVWVDTGHRRFLLVNGPEHVRELMVERAAELVKPDSQTIETGPPERAGADDGLPVAEFRAALSRGMGAGRVPDVLAAAAGAAAAETATWRDGARIPLMARMRRLAIAVTCRASFASSLSPVELARAERALRWSARTLQVRTPASVRLDRLKLDRRRRRMAFAELRALGRSLVANADTSRPTQLTATVHDLPSLASGLGQGHVEALLAELFTGAAGPLAQTAAWTLVRFGRECVPAQRLRAEWDAILPAGAAVEPQSLSRLPFTEAFVREVTRLHPTNDRITRQAVTETTLAGERVPPLTRVIVNVPALQRDPRSYDEPDRFLPERWLGARPNRHKLAYVAFGVGGRRCLGETMALAALRALLPGLGRSWEIETGRMRLSSGSRRQPAESVRATVRAR